MSVTATTRARTSPFMDMMFFGITGTLREFLCKAFVIKPVLELSMTKFRVAYLPVSLAFAIFVLLDVIHGVIVKGRNKMFVFMAWSLICIDANLVPLTIASPSAVEVMCVVVVLRW